MAVSWNQSQDIWSAYWRPGQNASLTEGSHPSGALDGHWLEFFSRLPSRARILDLASGNGYVARLAQAAARDRGADFEITGVDSAQITALILKHETTAPFLAGGVRIEALPYRPASFDAITSQFGFEYACELDATRELARVLKPAGAVRLILHARDGAIFTATTMRLNRLRQLTIKSGLTDAIVYGAIARACADGDGEALADETLARQRESLTWLRHAPPPEDAALFYADGLIDLWTKRSRYSPAELSTSVSDACRRIHAQTERLNAMLGAAHSHDSLELLRKHLTYCGIATSPPRAALDRDGAQIAWLLDGTRDSH